VSGLLEYLGGKQDALDLSLTGLNRHLILEVMLQIQALVREFIQVRGRYEKYLSLEDDMLEESDFIRRIPGSADLMRKLLRSLEVAQRLPKRLRWAMWDQDKFKGLVGRLKELNDSLVDLVDNSIKMQVFQMTTETNINLLGLYNKVDDLRQLFMALMQEKDSGGALSLHSSQHNSQGRSTSQYREGNDTELLGLTRFKALNQAIEQGTLDTSIAKELDLQQPSEQMKSSELDRTDIQLKDANPGGLNSLEGLRCEALYHGQRVWIEWKEYRPIDHNSTQPDPNILLRVQKLAALLRRDIKPSAFRALHCLGYFIDKKQNAHSRQEQQGGLGGFSHNSIEDAEYCDQQISLFGFVFAKPSGVDPTTVPVDLFELLNGPSKPSLTERIALAKAIANCVRYLHSVNWLHKGLRSHNVIFFPNKMNEVDYNMPYLTGFDYARPARGGEMTEPPPANPEYDIYKHPHAHPSASREGYKKSFDIYSLGIILAELAEWRSIDNILGIVDPSSTRSLVSLRIRRRLLTESVFMEGVAAGAGSLFAMSVRCCLEGGKALGIEDREDEINETVGTKLGKGFYEKVVRRLEKIRC